MELPAPLYALVRRLVPIACVDALPYRRSDRGIEIGLIRRLDADDSREVWNLVGGRVRYGETLADALTRHLRDALGAAAVWTLPDTERPPVAAQYFPHARLPMRRDPRKHAIALAYPVAVSGSIRPEGEALDFRWFDADALPDPDAVGFDQGDVIRCLAEIVTR
jgi:8-oxo-dGTP pyrophosphatase MutT (NUDIX family)